MIININQSKILMRDSQAELEPISRDSMDLFKAFSLEFLNIYAFNIFLIKE